MTTSTPSPDAEPSTGRPFAIVTGASSGIGLHLAKELVARGYDLVVSADNQEIHDAADSLREVGAQVWAVQSDLATADGVEELQTAVKDVGRPVDVNVAAPVNLAKQLLPDMVDRGQGRVLVTASVAGVMPGPWCATYAASKSFLLSWAEAIRYELRDSGVTVTALMPGPTDTDFFGRAGMQDTEVAATDKDRPEDVARDGVDALMDGRDHCVAHSRRNKVQVALGKGLLEPAKARMHAAMTREKN